MKLEGGEGENLGKKMDPSSLKRPLDQPSDGHHRHESNGSTSSASKRRPHPSMIRPPPPLLKLSPGETLFRVLCPADKTGAVIGKGGSIIRQFRQSTGAKIRIDDSVAAADERVILIVADAAAASGKRMRDHPPEEELENGVGSEDEDLVLASPAQQALVKVFERLVKADEERMMGGSAAEGEEASDERAGSGANVGPGSMQGLVVCRLLVQSNQVGCVLGKGGKIVERIRQETGAQIRILDKEQLPICAAAGDEVIQIMGSVSCVRKALLSVSSCLQENPKSDAATFFSPKPPGPVLRSGHSIPAQLDPFPHRGYAPGHASEHHQRSYSSIPGPDSMATGYRKVLEEEIVFRLLCSSDKVGSLIGKGGGIIRALQVETGASIKILESVPDSEEQVVLITAFENSELRHSPAQDAVMRVHSKIIEMTPDMGGSVSARLLVPAQQIGCLLGKGGSIIAEMRRATGASIRIFLKKQIPKCASPNDEVVQVHGSLPSVQDALFHITSRLRETILPKKPPTGSSGAYFSMGSDIPPMVRSRHEPSSPGHLHVSVEHLQRSHSLDRQAAPSHSMDHIGLSNVEQGPYSYGSERPGYGPPYDRPSSPKPWVPPALSSGNPRGIADSNTGLTAQTGTTGSQAAVVTNASVEVIVPQQLLGFVYGDKGGNLNQIRQISGAKVIIHDPKPGATEGVVFISGTPDQTHAAQTLLHAFVLCEQATP